MKNETLIDETILDGIPDELIRPLLAISIRATELNTTEDFERLFRDIQKISKRCSDAGGQSLYYVRVKKAATQRFSAAQAAETWVRQTDPAAEFGSVAISRWRVYCSSEEDTRTILVGYKRAGLDPDTMEEKIEFVITEASEDEL